MKLTWLIAVGGVCVGAWAQQPSQEKLPEPAPAQSPPKSDPAKDPSLDDLLGLPATKGSARPKTEMPESAKPSDREKAGGDANKAALDRLLTTEEVEEEFEQAVQLMGEASSRLNTAKDSGIETQRMQELILLKLDKLLDDAQKKQQKQKSSSSSSKQQQQKQQQQQGQQPKQQKSASEKNQSQPSPSSTAQGGQPNRRDGAGNAVNAGDGAQWGNLPQRERDSLVQGQGDSYSSTYRNKTEEYYKRLAEEPKNPSPK